MNKKTNNILVFDNNKVIDTINCSFDNLNNIMYKQNSINIFTINICRLKKHFVELYISIDNINKFKVIILTEAWLDLGNISINNFSIVRL